MKRLHILFILCLCASMMTAQEQQQPEAAPKTWTFDGIVGLNATGTGLINWTGGGKNTASGLLFAKLHLLYYKDAFAWESNFDSDFGVTWTHLDEEPWKKSSDNIKLKTKFGWEFKPGWYLTVLGGFESQYAVGREKRKGFDPAISKFLAPSYTDISIGFDWKTNVNGCNFSLYMSPAALLITTAYVSDVMNEAYNEEHRKMLPDEKNYDFRRELQMKYGTFKIVQDANGVPEIEWRDARFEVGLALEGTLAYKYDNMTLSSKLTLFTPYQGRGYNVKEAYEKTHPGETWNIPLEYSNLNRQFGYFDVNWDTSLSYQFAKVLNVTLSTSLRYLNGTLISDSNGVWKERVQFKTVVGIGLGYSF